MKYIDFECEFSSRIWFKEFKYHFICFDEDTLSKLNLSIRNEFSNDDQDGLFFFSQFLFKQVFKKWEGTLNPELVYFTTKMLVLTGCNLEARKISHGFEFHPGCLAWQLGSYHRAKNVKKFEFQNRLIELEKIIFQESNHSYAINGNNNLQQELLYWYLAFQSPDSCYQLYSEKPDLFSYVFPLAILIEKLIQKKDNETISKIIHKMNQITDKSIYEKMIVMNKTAVFYQLKGDQKNAIESFEYALELAKKLGDLLMAGKLSFNQGSSYFYISEYEFSLDYYRKAELLYKQVNDSTGVGKVYNALSAVYNVLGEFTIAEKYIKLAEKSFKYSNNEDMKNGIRYKQAILLQLRGYYKKAIQILDESTSTNSFLKLEQTLLKIWCNFELSHNFNINEINQVEKDSEKIGYTLGKGNVLFLIAKMFTIKGEIISSQIKLDQAYNIFQKINNFRGIMKVMNATAFNELLKGNFSIAEQYCLTALSHAKNNNFFIEEIEANNILAHLFFLKGEKEKAINIIDNCLFALETKNIKNSYYLQALKLRFIFELNSKNTFILSTSLIKLIKHSVNSGSQYWIHQSRLMEAYEFYESRIYSNTIEIIIQVIETSESFDIKFSAEKLFIKTLLDKLEYEEIDSKEKLILVSDLTKKINSLLDLSIISGLRLNTLEIQILKLKFHSIIDNSLNLQLEINKINKFVEEKKLYYFTPEIEKINRRSNIDEHSSHSYGIDKSIIIQI
jgi:tetratricopeptide (TPR) repeat protein